MSVLLNFSDPDQYAEALRVASAKLIVTGRGAFSASLMKTELDTVWMQRGYASVGRISQVRVIDRAHFAFLAEPGPPQRWAGREIGTGELFTLSAADELIMSTPAAGSWGTVSFERDALARVSVGLAGRDAANSRPRGAAYAVPPGLALDRLIRLHRRLERLARERPEVLRVSAVARQWDDALVRALLGTTATGPFEPDRSARRRHAALLRRLEAVLDARPGEPMTLTELCLATGVTERTLHACCQEFYGMSPVRYLRLRRMNLAQRALSRAMPGARSVTEIAARYGFWEFGRFAQRYRSLFGETPSQTLRRRG